MANIIDILFPGVKQVPKVLSAAKGTAAAELGGGASALAAYISSLLPKKTATTTLTTQQPTTTAITKPPVTTQTTLPTTTPVTKQAPITTDTGGGENDLMSLITGLAQPSDAYAKAIQSEEAMLPLIQQRYKTLLDELSASEEKQTTKQESAKDIQLGETRARASAAGTFAGTTELGTEDIIRKATADAITEIQQTGDIQKAKAIAQEGIDEANVANEIAKLGISQEAAQRSGLKDAISAILDIKKTQMEAGKGQIVKGADAFYKINPYTGAAEKIKGAVPPATSQELESINMAKTIQSNIATIPQSVKSNTGTATALSVLAKLNSPAGIGKLLLRSKNEQDLANLESQYFGLTQAVLTKVQGKRPSDYDAKTYQANFGASIQFPDAVNKQRIQNMVNILTATGSTDTGSDWEVLPQ